MRVRLIAAAVAAALAPPARAGSDEGGLPAADRPWSGYWWPHTRGGLQGPAAKYDAATGRQAAAWERAHHPATSGGRPVPGWYGFCHAWSAAAVMEKEPRRPASYSGPRGTVGLGVGDLKGLLALAHTRDVANTYGQRNNGNGRPNDIAPDELWRLLKLYVQQQRVPLVLDVDSGTQVWNYPVYAYRVTYSPTGRGAEHACAMELFMADDAVPPDFVGVHLKYDKYLFTCQMSGNSVVAGTARWSNERHHPDFAWYPYLAVAENPEVNLQAVRAITGSAGRSGPNVPPEPNPPTPNPPTPIPTPDPTPGGDPAPGPDPSPRPADRRVILISPLELAAVVANRTSAFDFDVYVDKFDNGRYSVGEALKVAGKSGRSGYLYLFELAPEAPKGGQDGGEQGDQYWPPLSLKLLFPLPGQDNRVEGGKPFAFPREGDKFAFAASGPVGTHKIKAIVTTRPLILSGLVPSQQQGQQSQQQQGQSAEFRLPTTQRQQFQEVITKHLQGKAVDAKLQEQTGGKPNDVLGEFAQDECPFYVGEAGKPEPPKPGKPEQGKPEQEKPEPPKPEPGKPEQGKPEQGKPEQAKPEPGKPEPGKAEPK